jgi:nucleotide-binding universal stress UspA family protein
MGKRNFYKLHYQEITMNKVEKILVPIDFSEESAAALKYALSLAKKTRAEVIALHVVDKSNDRDFFMSAVTVLEGSPFSNNEFTRIPVDILLQERSLDLWNFIEQTVDANQGVKITRRLRLGTLVKEMAAVSQEENIDLIILKLQKRFAFPGFGTLKLLRILRNLRCPVLLAPPKAKNHHEPARPVPVIQPTPEETIA